VIRVLRRRGLLQCADRCVLFIAQAMRKIDARFSPVASHADLWEPRRESRGPAIRF
jgi:hypothetical protein